MRNHPTPMSGRCRCQSESDTLYPGCRNYSSWSEYQVQTTSPRSNNVQIINTIFIPVIVGNNRDFMEFAMFIIMRKIQ
jgi:hypothetical protein